VCPVDDARPLRDDLVKKLAHFDGPSQVRGGFGRTLSEGEPILERGLSPEKDGTRLDSPPESSTANECFAPPMQALKEQLGVITKLVPAGAQLAYVDYPVHENIGDLLIMLGTHKFFEDHKCDVRYRASAFNFHPHPFLQDSKTVLVCHGGGNFGDLYPIFQHFRESLVRRYRSNRIIMLPQTMHFLDPKELKASAAVFREHPDLHLCVRDEQSHRLASEHFSANVYLVPDMAHQLWPLRDPRGHVEKAGNPELLLIRRDAEGAPLPAGIAQRRGEFRDWADLITRADWFLVRAAIRAQRLDALLHNTLPAAWAWRRYAGTLVRRAMRLFAGYERITTSRLHGHILACLMGKPNVLIDNSYGKNSAYYRTWTYRIRTADLAEVHPWR